MVSLESMTDASVAAASEAYIRYCGGLAVVQSPFETVGIHGYEDVERSVDEVLVVGEHIMFNSIKRMIRAVHDPDSPKESRYCFEQNEPKLRQVVAATCEASQPRLEALNQWYAILRPAPFLDRRVYSNVATNRYERVKLPELMDDFVPHRLFVGRSHYIERPSAS